MKENREIKNCNVCVIGGAGFIGSHLVDYLIDERGCNVTVLDNLITGKTKNIHEKAKFIWADIRDEESELVRIFEKENIDYVFNYAAEPYIPECFERPMHFFDINATAVLKVLNACQKSKIKAVLQVSSAEIYGDMKGKIKETDAVEAHSTYGVSKLAADGLVQVRWREANVPAISLRQFNCVGERETHEYVIPEIISQLAKSNVVNLGNNSFRDFQYAGDAAKMAVELLEKGQFGEVYNMGSEDGIMIYELAELIGRLMGHEETIIQTEDSRIRPWEIWHLQSDNTKLNNVIKSRPSVSLEEALEKTIKYFHENGSKWDW
jgi:nucleoside-diphosphate-sugar epimerase